MNVDCPLIIRHCIICGLVAECFFAQLLSIDSKFQIEQFFIIMIICEWTSVLYIPHYQDHYNEMLLFYWYKKWKENRDDEKEI